ncbi:DUF6519 domain-containing protein [Rhodovulum strictum]|uniref:Right handed beta helix domain-containing protein n=1 Tax=Rhodovulum strictum TaxID=58314 RepID=A0A844B1L5_9RHOB|nr:DUF6519 domain-containing protein [Rhodovulum strictum]MRH20011.1 hypothetical protein [Rhodovulum strictum]
MGGDYSKDSFDALRDYAGVFLQQGRPVLDSDWNEMVRVLERRIRAGTVDTIGRAVVPRETETGFHIRLAGGGIEIGPGRLYLDGMLVENHGNADFARAGDGPAPVFDRGTGPATAPLGVLDEMTSPPEGYVAYGAQPWWPTPEDPPRGGGPVLAYLVVWRREVTALIDPTLLDPALGGVDSATRWQTVWQVRLLGGIGTGATCATPETALAGWAATIAPSTARLSTDTVDVEDPEDPCLVPPTDGYTGLENQFYRVEIHQVGESGAQSDAWFKYSRENASVAAAIDSFAASADRITVRSIGRDEILRFREGNWVEITDDRREFDHRSGQILRIAAVREDMREIELEGSIDPDLIPTGLDGDTARARHSRLIRWDQTGVIRNSADNSVWWDLDAENPGAPPGLIPVPPAGTVLLLESGITVAFSTAPGAGRYRAMDAWRFRARTAGTQIERLTEAPPDSVQRHYCKLAVLPSANAAPDDCRIFWPPEPAQIPAAEGCACSVCVTPESHASGALTIQTGIDRVAAAGGGTVCLNPGRYELREALRMANLFGVTLKGHGITTVLSFQNAVGAAIEIDTCIDIRIEDLSIIVAPESAGSTAPGAASAHGLRATHTATMALRRLAILVLASGPTRQDHGIVLEGIVMAAKIEECLIAAPMGIGSVSAFDAMGGGGVVAAVEPRPGWLALAELRMLDNIVFADNVGLRLVGLAFSLAGTTMARNVFSGSMAGVALNWFELPTGGAALDGNTIQSEGPAAVIGVNDIRLQDNEISGGPVAADGIFIMPNVVPEAPISAQLIGNRISDLGGAGIRIAGHYDALLIKRNQIRRCGLAGIMSQPGFDGRHIAIEDNVIEEIRGGPNGVGAAGIVLLGVIEGQARGNSIRRIGREMPDGSQNAGIALQGVIGMAVEGNTIYEIGPDRAEARAWGVLVRPPWFQMSIADNRIDGSTERRGEFTAWQAIEIGAEEDIARIGDGVALLEGFTGAMGAVPGIDRRAIGYAAIDGRLYALTHFDAFEVAPILPVQLGVAGNQVIHFAPQLAPAVTIVARGTASVDFSRNQCDLLGGANIAAQVIVVAERITAGANSLRHPRDAGLSLLLATRAAAPVGNITSAGVQVTPAGLPAAFAALNIIAP